jgi:PIN domain nuclease of toxin-antitoxin system
MYELALGYTHFPLVHKRRRSSPPRLACRLVEPQAPEIYLPRERERHQILSLSLDESAIRHLADLPPLHRDPFDRMLLCQAIERNLIFMTVDETLLNYPVKTFPKT